MSQIDDDHLQASDPSPIIGVVRIGAELDPNPPGQMIDGDPAGGSCTTVEILDDGELVFTRHSKIEVGWVPDPEPGITLSRGAFQSVVDLVNGRRVAAERDLPPFDPAQLRRDEGTGEPPVEVARLDGLRVTVLVDHPPAPAPAERDHQLQLQNDRADDEPPRTKELTMTTIDALRRALERIRDYRPSGALNEWSEADAFRAVQEIAADALNPGVRAARIDADEAVRVSDRHRVAALQRGARYWVHDSAGTGAWVRFLKGDAEREGIVHVKVLEVFGRPNNTTYRVGAELEFWAGHLKAAPGQPEEQRR